MELPIFLVLAAGGLIVFRWMGRTRSSEYSMANARFVEVTNVSELDHVFSSSHSQTQLLFLYDPWCPISNAASRQITRLDREVMAVDVSRRHDLSRQIEVRTGIRHESPQAIVLENGVAVWDASHSSIDSRAIALVIGESAIDAPVSPGSRAASAE